MTRILFICGKARMRSPTAVEVAQAWPNLAADCAGLSRDADEPLTREALEWADVIFVMETRQKKRLSPLFGAVAKGKSVVSMDIPDRFSFMEPDLVEQIDKALTRRFGPPPNRDLL